MTRLLPLVFISLLSPMLYGQSSGQNGISRTGSGSAPTLPTASSVGQVPVSTGAGTTPAPQQAPLSFGGHADQYIQQPLNNNYFTTLRVNSLNKVFYVDGFNNYGGIGVAPVAWSAATNQPQCQVVSYSGSYYIALNSINNTTTPGTYYGVWYPVPNNAAATNADCAWYMAASYMRQYHQSDLVQFGAGRYTTNQSFVNPVDGNSYDDEFSVSAKGCGSGCTYLTYTGATAIPVFNRPTGGKNFTSMQIDDMTIDGGAAASAAIELGSLGQSYFNNLATGHVAPGSDHVIEFGHFGGDAFQVFATNINIGVYPDTGTQNCGLFKANVVGGAITSYTVNNGGNCYATYKGNTELTVVSLRGYRGGAYTTPCVTMPTGMKATIVGKSVTAIDPGSNKGSGCSGTIDVQVYQTPNVNYGVIFNNSDSSTKDITSYSGSIAAFRTGGGDSTFIHLHPSVVPNGIITIGGVHFVGTEIDDVGGYGFQIEYPFPGEGTSIDGTNGYVGGNRFLNGSALYYFAKATTAADPVNIGSSGALCTATPAHTASPPDWQEFVTQSGTINSPADYLAKAPAGLSVLGNDTSCGQAMGNYTPMLTVGSMTLADNVRAPAFVPHAGAAGPNSTFFDDFYTGANIASDPIGSPTGDVCSPSDTYTDNNHPGNMLLTSGTAGTGTGIVCGLISEGPSIVSANTAQGWSWETAVYIPVLPGIMAGSYQAGMAHTPNANPWTTGVGFYLSSANRVANDWYCRYNSTSTDSGVAATVAWTRLTMVNDGTDVHWYIGGTQVCGTGIKTAKMPSTTLYPAVWSATSLGTASVSMAYDYINWQRMVNR
jgi:hypothetical protein